MSCIELIGCTSSGKSTLINAILHFCRGEGIDAWLGEDFVLRHVRIEKIKNEAARAVLVNLIAIFFAFASWRKNHKFYRYIIRFISQLPASVRLSEKLYIGKNILKNIGIYEIVQRHIADNQFVFLDEGPFHTAQVLFVRLAGEGQDIDLSTFVSLVPLPDIVIYLQQGEDVLIERTLARKHKRIPDGSRTFAKLFIKGSIATFDKLIQYPEVKQRLLKVDNNNEHITVPESEQFGSLFQIVLKALRAGLDLVNLEYLNTYVIRD